MITQTAEYALRAVVYLADQDAPQTTSTIAQKTQIPAGYLSKVMQGLNKAGFVHSQRGLHGGFLLTRAPAEVTVLQVVNAVEPVRRYHECPLGLHGQNLCPLHRKLDDAAQSIEESFGETTISDLHQVPSGPKPLCSFPVDKAGRAAPCASATQEVGSIGTLASDARSYRAGYRQTLGPHSPREGTEE